MSADSYLRCHAKVDTLKALLLHDTTEALHHYGCNIISSDKENQTKPKYFTVLYPKPGF